MLKIILTLYLCVFISLADEDDCRKQKFEDHNIIEDVNRVVSVVDKVIRQFECERDETIEQLKVNLQYS